MEVGGLGTQHEEPPPQTHRERERERTPQVLAACLTPGEMNSCYLAVSRFLIFEGTRSVLSIGKENERLISNATKRWNGLSFIVTKHDFTHLIDFHLFISLLEPSTFQVLQSCKIYDQQVVFSKHATVKILVAYWAHFIDNTDQYLKSLLYSNVLCNSSKYNKCSGKVEIKYYRVPGFNLTGPATQKGTSTGNVYPGYTRVNHGKYAVSDVRAHIGTSNLIWDYFYTTAGVSFGTYNPAIVSQLQQIFDADWSSPYAIPVEELEVGHACPR